MIPALFNVPIDRQQLARFSFANNDAHVLAIRAIYAKTGILLPNYPIDPIPPNDWQGWAYSHQAMHNSVNAALSLTGNDLTDVDPRQIDQLTYWIQIHASEHVSWGNALGYG